MQPIIKRLQAEFPVLRFTPGQQFCWSPETSEIFYKASARGPKAIWSLLHETGHALLQHQSYEDDFELLKLEVVAWDKARALANGVNVVIDEDHIEDCLDTYRDWLHRRSICPRCGVQCLQQDNPQFYRCFNCHSAWRVGLNRFCRVYRSASKLDQQSVPF